MGQIHNIAVVGHGTCGKTSLVEELLARAKAISRAGKVDDGSSVLDYEEDEKERRFTIDAKLGHLTHEGETLQLIDTPGYPDFVATAIDALSVVETALIAVDATQGIRVNTRRVWDEAGKLNVARMIVITRIDADQARFDETVAEIREHFGRRCVPLFLPDTVGPNVSKIENTLHVDDSSSDRAKQMHEHLVESVVEADEDLMERYLAEEEITPQEVDDVLAQAIVKGAVVPILAVSVHKDFGVNKTLEILTQLTPAHDAPIPRPMREIAGEVVDEQPVGGPDDPFLARVFKIVSDPFVGKLSYVRVFSGTLKANSPFQNLSRGEKERATSLLRMQGKEQENLDSVGPGQIIALPKAESLHIGDSIGDPARTTILRSVPHPNPMVKLAVEPKDRKDEAKLFQALKKLDECDSGFLAERIVQTGELVIAGRSTLHLDIVLGRLKGRFDLEVDTRVPKTSYFESITGNAEAHHKHKKQTGGRGQFGEVYIRLAPKEDQDAEDPLEFENSIVGGVIPTQFIPAVEKGIRETMESGILAECPVVGCKVTLYDGSFHNVDSSEAAFKSAGREAFKKAFMDAKPCLLEPIVNIDIHVPIQFMGDITGDLNSRRGRITGMDTHGETQSIRAQVPEAEIKSYSTELRSLTGGEGGYSVEFSHYEVVPGNVQQQVVNDLSKAKEE